MLVQISMSVDRAYTGDRISIELPFSQLSCCLSELEFLELDAAGAFYKQDHVFPTLTNLEQKNEQQQQLD